MRAPELTALLRRAMPVLARSRAELRDLDAAIGDGDLGITVAGGAEAVGTALADDAALADGTTQAADVAGVLKVCAQKFAAANPSTMSALVAAGLLAAAKTLTAVEDLGRAEMLTAITAAATTMQQRGGAEPGDKTVLDALLPSVEALRTAGTDHRQALRAMIAAARAGVDDTRGLRSQRGRAAWVGERSIGHPDGGAVAYLRLLEAIDLAWPPAGTIHPAPESE
jgi:phosphoenolpyruvate---glycerone phosphotransferase subunit DhaL